ncbi:MAG: GAF domain-containing sensor histidine kinase [Anaerolineae bacterium]|nr:GAF domain-containing sensor histidine kinase [Anaerolineae bacterium]
MTRDEEKTREQLINELAEMRQCLATLEAAKTQHKATEEQLQRYVTRLRTLRAMDRAILEGNSPDEVSQAALRHICQLVPCNWAGITTVDLAAHEATLIALQGDRQTPLREGARFPLEQCEEIVTALQQAEVYQIPAASELSHKPSLVTNLATVGLCSFLFVPLHFHSELLGCLNLAADRERFFSAEHVEIAREIADLLAIALQHTHLLAEMQTGHERLRLVSRLLVQAQEAERHRIARELHDEFGQNLTALKITLQAVKRLSDVPDLIPYLEEGIDTVDRTLQQMRDLSLELHPPLLDDLGLVPALRWYVDSLAQRGAFTAHFSADPFTTRLPSEIEVTCFRLAQEALTNVMKHAQARRVYVELRRRDRDLCLIVRDDGLGFDVASALEAATHGSSLGLLGMQERAALVGGQVEIESVPRRGTEVRATIPLPHATPWRERDITDEAD